MSDPIHPKPGDKHIDVSDIALVDIMPDEVPRLVKLRDGADKAMANAERLKPEEIERAGINEKDLQRLLLLIAEHRRLVEVAPAAEKLAELIYETRLDRGHHISVLFGEICSQARRRAAHAPDGGSVLGPLEDLLDYQYGPANRAAATREKTKASRAGEATGSQGSQTSNPR